eukprot:1194997-Prorocentrum_minimum.AAC.6
MSACGPTDLLGGIGPQVHQLEGLCAKLLPQHTGLVAILLSPLRQRPCKLKSFPPPWVDQHVLGRSQPTSASSVTAFSSIQQPWERISGGQSGIPVACRLTRVEGLKEVRGGVPDFGWVWPFPPE